MKKFLKIVLFLIILILLFRGWIFRHLVTYTSIGERPAYAITNPTLENCVNNARFHDGTDIETIIKTSLSITSEHLNFTAGKNTSNPNDLITSKTANCIGYATFFTTICNALLKKQHLSDEYKVTAKIGQLYVWGTNIHPYFNSPFFRDHDFAIIENTRTGQVYAVDPTVHDYFLIDFIRLAN
jgi:hypothetical protein